MGIFKDDPPQPPSPTATAAAQTGTNVSTAIANSYLNQVNQVTPDGNLTYETTGNYGYTDPSTGLSYNIPQKTATQTMSPQAQAIKSEQDQTKFTLAQMSNNLSKNIAGHLSQPLNLSGAPGGGQADNLYGYAAATGYNGGGNIQKNLGPLEDITKDYGPADNFGADRQRVEEALYGRLNPQLSRERTNVEQRLADQGIRYGSAAYAAAMDDYNRQANDLRLGVTAQGGAEQQRLNQMEAQRAAFQNSAQQQGYEQMLGQGTFANQAQNQAYAQNAAQAAFYNAGQGQNFGQQQSIFNASNAARNQYLQEQYQLRNQPLNEVSALMSGSQLNNPSWLNTPSSQIPTTDVAGIQNANFNQQMSAYNAQNAAWNALAGGIGANVAGGIKAMPSDERVKRDIKRIGTVFSTNEDDKPGMNSVIGEKAGPKLASVLGERDELPIYEYRYKGKFDDGERHVGPMAQDVEKLDPKAVREIDGVKHINTRRVMGNILRAA